MIYIMSKSKNRADAIKKLKDAIEILEHEVYKLIENCQHNWQPTSGKISAKCTECGEWMPGWYCEDSPTKTCKYSTDYDICDICGQPEERK